MAICASWALRPRCCSRLVPGINIRETYSIPHSSWPKARRRAPYPQLLHAGQAGPPLSAAALLRRESLFGLLLLLLLRACCTALRSQTALQVETESRNRAHTSPTPFQAIPATATGPILHWSRPRPCLVLPLRAGRAKLISEQGSIARASVPHFNS